MVRGKQTGKPKVCARKSTGGVAPRRHMNPPKAPRRQRETARKSTGGFQLSRFIRHDRYEDSNDDSSEDSDYVQVEVDDEPQQPLQVPPEPILSRRSSDNLTPAVGGLVLQRCNVARSATSTSTEPSGGQDGHRDRLVAIFPITCRTPNLSRSGAEAESSRTVADRTEEVNTYVAALTSSSASPMNTQHQRENLVVADSTNLSTANASTCEPSSTSMGAPPFVPPPAVPGHSRWEAPQDNPNTGSTESTPQTTSSLPAPRRKKKHFTPLAFSERDIESTPEKLRRSSGSQENPFVVTESENSNNSHALSFSRTRNRTIDAKKVKKAFGSFQSIRRLLMDSGACSHFNGFVHLNAVEQMLIKCYKYTKKDHKATDANLESENPPVIVLADDPPRNLMNEAITNARNMLLNPASVSTLMGVNPIVGLSNTEKKTSDSSNSPPSMMTELESNRSSSADINLPSSSSSASTTSLTGTNNVARKNASIVPPPASTTPTIPNAEKGSSIVRSATAYARKSLTTIKTESTTTASSSSTGDHIDEVINAVVRIGSSAPRPLGRVAGAEVNNSPHRHPSLVTNADLLAQMSDSHKETLNRLVLMGFGSSEEGQIFNQLLNIVRDNNGNLGACLDKLTR